MERRTVDTRFGKIEYILTQKRVKNLNLRLNPQGELLVSVPLRYTGEQADRFVADKAAWVVRHRQQQAARQARPVPQALEGVEIVRRLSKALEAVYPLIAPYGVAYPELRIRTLKSQWGNCHWNRGYITLNTALAHCPEHLRRYVALHELVHFLHHDHGPGFYAEMDRLMPGWREYRWELKTWVGLTTE